MPKVNAGSHVPRNRVRVRFGIHSTLLMLLLGLLVWGPPRIRLPTARVSPQAQAEILSFEGPFHFDVANLSHAIAWGVAGLIAYVALLYRPQYFIPRLFSTPLRWYVLYGLLAIASAVYSPSPMYTVFFASKILILATLALLLAGTSTTYRPLRTLLAVFAVQWAVIAVLYKIRPDLVGVSSPLFGYRLYGGILPDYGESAAIVGIFIMARLMFGHKSAFRTRVALWLIYALSWVFLALSQTRSAMFASLLAACILLVLSRSSYRKLTLGLAAGISLVVILTLGAGVGIERYLARGQTVEQLQSLSGRDVAFTYLVDMWKARPLLGYGYAAGSRDLMSAFVGETGMGMGSAHDAASRVLADLGLAGAVILTAALFTSWRSVVVIWRRSLVGRAQVEEAAVLLGLLLFSTVTSAFGGGIAGGSPVFILVLVTATQMRRKQLATANSLRSAPSESGTVRV